MFSQKTQMFKIQTLSHHIRDPKPKSQISKSLHFRKKRRLSLKEKTLQASLLIMEMVYSERIKKINHIAKSFSQKVKKLKSTGEKKKT